MLLIVQYKFPINSERQRKKATVPTIQTIIIICLFSTSKVDDKKTGNKKDNGENP